MDRIGESIYEIRRGTFTTIEEDNPPWSFRFNSGTGDLDEIIYGRDASGPTLPRSPATGRCNAS